jgi:hypothetical protein
MLEVIKSTPTQQQAQAKNEQRQHKLAKQEPSFLVNYHLLFRQIWPHESSQ